MADISPLQAFTSVLLTFSIFLSYPEESVSIRGIPVTLFSKSGDRYLGVLGNVPDAEIRMINSFTFRTAQWYYFRGSLQWEKNRAFCLTPDCSTEMLMLKSCSSATGMWELERKKDQRIYYSKCKDLKLTRISDKLSMSPYQKGTIQKWVCAFDLVMSLKSVPPLKYPTKEKYETILREVLKSSVNTFTPAVDRLPFPRNVKSFPGTVQSRTRRISQTLVLKNVWKIGKYDLKAVMNIPEIWYPTQLYVPPGELIEITLPRKLAKDAARDICLRVGAHENIGTNDTYYRMPIVSESYSLYPGINLVRSQYGGNLIFNFIKVNQITVNVSVKGVVKGPYFQLGVTNRKKWASVKRNDSPHVVLVSRRCVIVVPRAFSLKVVRPESVLKKYDRNVKLAEELAGFDEKDPPPPGYQWFVNEIQPMKSYLGGFPCSIDRRVHDLMKETTPDSKDIWRCIGYNYYQHIWESSFRRTPLVNLFVMYMHEKIMDSSLVNSNLSSKVYQDLKHGLTYDDVNDEEKIVFFLDLLRAATGKRWRIFSDLHRQGRKLNNSELDMLKNDPLYRIDFVYKELSKSAGKDLLPVFKRWGFIIKTEGGTNSQDPCSSLSLGAFFLPAFLSIFVLNARRSH